MNYANSLRLLFIIVATQFLTILIFRATLPLKSISLILDL
jgi:hypothetical protein